jgi:exopolysaccharide biosynthesis polyprenyl glycosylphosphotransferase
MLRRFSVNLAILSMVVDMGWVVAGMIFTILMVENHLPSTRNIGSYFTPATFFAFPVIWWAIFLMGSLYDGRRNSRIADELTSFVILSLFATVTLAGVIYLFLIMIPPVEFLIFVAFTVAMQLLLRVCLRLAWRLGWQSKNGNGTPRILIIGAGKVGRRVREQLRRYNSHHPIQFIGFLDDNPGKQTLPDTLGSVLNVLRVVNEQHVSDVIITLPDSAYQLRECVVEILTGLSINVWVIPNVFRLALYQPTIETFAGIPMVDLRSPAINEYQRLAKRIFDLSIALFMLLFLWPVMAAIVVLIRRDSPGPAIFRQQRIGENNQLFEMYKFRTMVQNAEQIRHLVEQRIETGEILHKSPNDPRVTRIGRFLRSTSLDELPQLFNVLRGEMSLVGPRPELPYLVEQYKPWQHARFSVPPGITGWWQINGRSDKPMHLHTEDDIYYVQNCSIWLDIQILLKTAIVVILRKGAY